MISYNSGCPIVLYTVNISDPHLMHESYFLIARQVHLFVQ